MSSDREAGHPGRRRDRADLDVPALSPRGRVDLGDVAPARSRHAGKRSAVSLEDDLLVVGTADGTIRGLDPDSLTERWRTESGSHPDEGGGSVVSLASTAEQVIAGNRGTAGRIRGIDRRTGEVRWRHAAAADVGNPTKETRFFLPFVVDVAAVDDQIYAAARRYERDGDERRFESVIYAFSPAGGLRWRYCTDASPIALSAVGDRIAVAYNRCPGEHDTGVVVLAADDGTECLAWDPPGTGDRRVGDVSLLPAGLAITSHADHRGYRLDADGTVRWQADLAAPIDADGERLYAYPNHVHATAEGVVFVTGNTYPEEGRETNSRHPGEHTAFGFASDGTRRWTAGVGGFAAELAADGGHVAIPGAQNFRTRDPATHGLRTFDVVEGPRATLPTDGVSAAGTVAGDTVATIEEPVSYHDDTETRGAYRLHLGGE